MTAQRRDPRSRGLLHGARHRAAVRANVAGFRAAAVAAGWDLAALETAGTDLYRRLGERDRAELDAIAQAAGIAPGAHRAFALTGPVVAPEECTVAAAVGQASANGATVLLKNSDKIGADSLVGHGYHRYKEINVVNDQVSDDGIRIVGVVAAGTISFKMGVNDAGVAVASNIVRTTELRMRERTLDDLRALDRGRILGRALHYRSAWEAAAWAIEAISETPMATPGNVHFAQADHMFVVEGSYDRAAMERVHDRVVVRANGFVLLDELNDPEDDSSPARRARALDLLLPLVGSITADDLRMVSSDHGNGPGLRSICRHSEDPADETTLSALIVAFDPDEPTASAVDIALGKPCWSWGSSDASTRIDLRSAETVPPRFSNGSAWIEAYREDARSE